MLSGFLGGPICAAREGQVRVAMLTAAGEGQHDIEHEISEEMRRDIGHEVAKFHIKSVKNPAQHECRNDTAYALP